MLVLSFRDLAASRAGAVTPGVMLSLGGAIGPAFDWNDPASLRDRLRSGAATYVGDQQTRAQLSGKSLCFLIHGFNVNRDRGYAGLGALAQELLGLGPSPVPGGVDGPPAAGADLVIPVLWPGDWWLPGVNYPFELADAHETAQRFAEFLAGPALRAASLSFVTHSMGARVALETLAQARWAAPTDALVLTAPAVDDDALDDPRYAPAVAAVRRIMVVSSVKDSVLRDAFPLGDRVEAALWRGEHSSSRALGAFGPRLKPGSPAAAKLRWFPIGPGDDYGHGDYVPGPWKTDEQPNGWTPKRARVGGFLRSAFSGGALQPIWPPEQPPG
ncbi:MAG: alpha/beta hydrolase [Phenylobacterium sp.]|uniref:alpha/beta hydrolase n=1 Tax=Phenylobacterium sp. TaxID=1871053 RepID=UPI0027337967|nr:alpha/beta hydrolase [Phenylobacterium sp.]MDP3174515.1 alpha/beta hydrolase [Phenylobacterium sp.]